MLDWNNTESPIFSICLKWYQFPKKLHRSRSKLSIDQTIENATTRQHARENLTHAQSFFSSVRFRVKDAHANFNTYACGKSDIPLRHKLLHGMSKLISTTIIAGCLIFLDKLGMLSRLSSRRLQKSVLLSAFIRVRSQWLRTRAVQLKRSNLFLWREWIGGSIRFWKARRSWKKLIVTFNSKTRG